MKNTKSEIKPIKVGKQSGTRYCFGCKDYTKNVRPQEVKMINNLTVLFGYQINQDF